MIPSIARSYRATASAAIFDRMTLPEPGPNVPRRGGALRAALGRAMLRLLRWRIGGGPPDLAKCVIIAAPHSSNRDFFVGIAVVFALRLDAHFIGKAELFRGPLGPIMRWLGGLAVDRSHPEGVVPETVALFQARESLMLAVAPEGTRKPVPRWKSGFYRIALGAGVPIVPGYFDNGRRVVGFGEAFYPTGDAEADIAALRAFYTPIPRRDGVRVYSEPAQASGAERRS
jgi:1-acyl-sn-glycerol-3-phosphate acyltransferase